MRFQPEGTWFPTRNEKLQQIPRSLPPPRRHARSYKATRKCTVRTDISVLSDHAGWLERNETIEVQACVKDDGGWPKAHTPAPAEPTVLLL